jgi:hypothetical protein
MASNDGSINVNIADTDNRSVWREYGDNLIVEKGGDPKEYKSGMCYRYPWVRHRMKVTLGDEYDDRENIPYEIYGSDNGEQLVEGEYCGG